MAEDQKHDAEIIKPYVAPYVCMMHGVFRTAGAARCAGPSGPMAIVEPRWRSGAAVETERNGRVTRDGPVATDDRQGRVARGCCKDELTSRPDQSDQQLRIFWACGARGESATSLKLRGYRVSRRQRAGHASNTTGVLLSRIIVGWCGPPTGELPTLRAVRYALRDETASEAY